MEKVFIHMRKSTLMMAGCLFIICLVPFLTQVSAAKQNVVTETVVVTPNSFAYTSFGMHNVVDLSDHRVYFNFEAMNASNVDVNITFMILDAYLSTKYWGLFNNISDSAYLYKVANVSSRQGSVDIPDDQDYYFIFQNKNNFNATVTYSIDKEDKGTLALIAGSIIGGIGVLGFIVVIILRKRHQSPDVPVETNP